MKWVNLGTLLSFRIFFILLRYSINRSVRFSDDISFCSIRFVIIIYSSILRMSSWSLPKGVSTRLPLLVILSLTLSSSVQTIRFFGFSQSSLSSEFLSVLGSFCFFFYAIIPSLYFFFHEKHQFLLRSVCYFELPG